MIHLPVTKAHWLYIPRSGIHPVKKYAGDINICFEKQLIQGICLHLRYIFQPKSKISYPPTVPLGLAWHSSSASVGVWGAPAKIEENKHFTPPTWKWTSETDNKIRFILPGHPSEWRKMPTSLLLQVACSKKGPAQKFANQLSKGFMNMHIFLHQLPQKHIPLQIKGSAWVLCAEDLFNSKSFACFCDFSTGCKWNKEYSWWDTKPCWNSKSQKITKIPKGSLPEVFASGNL